MIRVLITLLVLSFPSFAEEVVDDAKIEELRAKSEAYLSQLDGDWKGKISGLELDGDYPNEPYKSEIIIRISKNTVHVGTKKDGKWYIMPYDFKIERYKTHAVIYAFAANGGWVEGYNFLVTLNSIDEMKLLWSRVVNNYMLTSDEKEGRGYFQGASILKRQ